MYLERHLLAFHREELQLDEEGAPFVEEMDMLGFPWEEPSRNMQQQEQPPPHATTWYSSSVLEDGHAGPFSPSSWRMGEWSGQPRSINSGESPGRQRASDSFGRALSGRLGSKQTSLAHELHSQRTARETARESARQSVRESVSRRGALSQRAREQGLQREYLYGASAAEIVEHNELHTHLHVERQKQAYWTQLVDWDALDSKRVTSRGGGDRSYRPISPLDEDLKALVRVGEQALALIDEQRVEPRRLPPPQHAAMDSRHSQTSSDEPSAKSLAMEQLHLTASTPSST